MQSVYWNFAFNIFINSTLMFITVIILVELFLFVLRIKQQRVKAICRTLPIFKLGVDLSLYNFSSWALMENLNPILAQPGSRILSFMLGISPPELTSPPSLNTGIQLFLNDDKTFTLADLVILSTDIIWIKIIVTGVLTLSLWFCLAYLYRLFVSHKSMKNLQDRAFPSSRKVTDPILSSALHRAKVRILTSNKAPVPLAVGVIKKRIIFPAALINQLTQQEYEAVIAHELAHLRWYDAITRFLANLILHFFWWIPSKKWLAYLEHTQERGCDDTVRNYAIPRIALARAIVKSAKQAKIGSLPLSALCFVKKNQILARMQAILNETMPKRSIFFKVFQYTLALGCMLALLYGKFWIF